MNLLEAVMTLLRNKFVWVRVNKVRDPPKWCA
jgi:hypothetical protein